MIDLTGLGAALGQMVELEFRDGAVVQAQLLLITLHDPQRLIYKVRQTTASVPNTRSGLIVTVDARGAQGVASNLSQRRTWRWIALVDCGPTGSIHFRQHSRVAMRNPTVAVTTALRSSGAWWITGVQ